MGFSIFKFLPYLALIFAHIIWGANFVVAKVTLQEFPPFSLALFRFAFASLLLAPFFIIETKKTKIKVEDLPNLVGAGVFIITLNIAFFFEGIVRTSAINASVLTLVIPLVSVILGWIFLKESVYLINLAGIFLGLVGSLLIIGLPDIISGSYSPQVLTGNMLIILASVAFVVGAIFSRKLLDKYSSLVVTAIAFLIGTITFLIPAGSEYLKDPSWPTRISMLGFLGLIYMTFLSSISAYFLFEWGLARLGVIKADIFQYVEPVVATSLAVIILSETISASFILGTILILAGVWLGNILKEAHHRSHKAHRV